MMAVKPIIFSGPMVKALLAGTKTQTRRVIKPQPFIDRMGNFCTPDRKGVFWNWGQRVDGTPCTRNFIRERLSYAPGDLLYVREAYRVASWNEDDYCWLEYQADKQRSEALPAPEEYIEALCADLGRRGAKTDESGNYACDDGILPRVHPSIHMPRWASRLTLEVTNVRVQRVRDISPEDAIAEGIDRWMTVGEAREAGGLAWGGIPERAPDDAVFWIADYDKTLDEDADRAITLDPREAYRALWDSLHGEGASDQNPWVAAYTFTVHQANVDDLLRQREAA